ncbi:TPA: hypothetical protein DCZ32_00220, partial [Candidatus Uhrbacteria bacterium]|nr:hypothetical protein [Candidatus Uhrbacteria bacterium]
MLAKILFTGLRPTENAMKKNLFLVAFAAFTLSLTTPALGDPPKSKTSSVTFSFNDNGGTVTVSGDSIAVKRILDALGRLAVAEACAEDKNGCASA